MSSSPEQKARQDIDRALQASGWTVQDRAGMNLAATPGVAVREFRMAPGHGFADYLLFVNGKAVGVVEAKPAGYALRNVELQADKYAGGLPAGLNPPVHPLPFLYVSTGVETCFINGLDPDPKTRAMSANLPHIHRPETLTEWIAAETLDAWVKRLHAEGGGLYTAADDTKPSSFRGRITTMPPLDRGSLYLNQIEATGDRVSYETEAMTMIRELDRVVLTKPLPALALEAGDLGTVVLVHEGGRGFEVEFVTLGGDTLAVTTLMTDDVRPVDRNEIAHARPVAAA